MLTLRGATLLDGVGHDPVADPVITIDGNRIAGIGRPATGTVLDLDGLTLLPGLIDVHTHMGIVAPQGPTSLSPAMTAALLFQNAELCVQPRPRRRRRGRAGRRHRGRGRPAGRHRDPR